MNRSLIIPDPQSFSNENRTKTYDHGFIWAALEASGFSPRKAGREIKFSSGSDVYALNPQKGLWIGSAGSGTITSLLGSLNIHLRPAESPAPSTENKNRNEKIVRIIRESTKIIEIDENSRPVLRSGKAAVEKYLASRGLPLLLPKEARVLVQPDGFDLIVPLICNDFPSVHITALTRDGRKRSLSWTGGSCRHTLGSLSGSYAAIPAAEEQLSVPPFADTRFYAIGEGLETVLSGQVLTGWPSIFAINSNGLRTFLDNQETVRIFREAGAGVAILVDRDESGTGQKAASALAHKAIEAGIPVLYLLPPGVVKGGEKGADWNDAMVEFGIDGARAAFMLAIGRSEEALSKAEIGKVLPIDRIRDFAGPGGTVDRVSLDDASLKVRSLSADHLGQKRGKPGVGAVDPGVGKSKILADLSWNHQLEGDPLLTIVPTRALAEEAATKGGGLFREGRTDNQERAGHCPIFPEVVPFSEKWRSVVAHKCHDCQNGKAAMEILSGAVGSPKPPEIQPCAHILHIHDTRTSPVITSTASMLEGDPGIGVCAAGENMVQRKVVLDDSTNLNDHRCVHGGHISEWIRAANRAIRHDLAKISFGESSDGPENRQDRIDTTKALIPHLSTLAHFLSGNAGEEQICLAPEAWEEFSRLAKSPNLRWMDGTAAEAIFRDDEGALEIPVRTLKTLGEAIQRGTAWVRKSVLHFASPTRAFEAIRNGALVLDATPPRAVRQIVESLGGDVNEIRVQQPSLVVRQVIGGSHGKTACLPDSPSFEHEKSRFLFVVNSAVEKHGAENIAVLSHKSFISAISEDIPSGVDCGWWGCHNRGLNDWETKKHIVIWGVPQLSPSVSEREYMSDRQAVIEAGGTAWPEWNGGRAEKWYRIPGQAKEIHATGYQAEFIDIWARERTTAEVVQAIGRLRAVRRPEEKLSVEIHSSFPLSETFGLEIHEIGRPAWRTISDYQVERKDSQIERGIIAALATGGGGRRVVNDWLLSHFLKGIKPADWASIKKMASGSRLEYISLGSGTTLEITDDEALVRVICRILSEWAGEGVLPDLLDAIRSGDYVAGTTGEEALAMAVLRASAANNRPPDRIIRSKIL